MPHGCSTTPAELQAEKKVVLNFFRPRITSRELIALIDPKYIQHNPLVLKFATEKHISDYEAFKLLFTQMALSGSPSGGDVLDGPDRRGGRAPQAVIVIAECDLVTAIIRHAPRSDRAAEKSSEIKFCDTPLTQLQLKVDVPISSIAADNAPFDRQLSHAGPNRAWEKRRRQENGRRAVELRKKMEPALYTLGHSFHDFLAITCLTKRLDEPNGSVALTVIQIFRIDDAGAVFLGYRARGINCFSVSA